MLDIELINSRLIGSTFISNIKYFNEIGSTNDYAKNPELGDNILILTEFQLSGRGRFGRKWESKKGENLTFTIRKKIDVVPEKIQSVNFFFSYFLLNAIENFMEQQGTTNSIELEVKWPNDILLENKKLSGLLVEYDNDRNFLIGIGLNVNQNLFTREYDLKTISLSKALGKPVNITLLLINIINTFNSSLHLLLAKQYEKIYKLWLSRCRIIGKKVDFIYPDKVMNSGYVVNVLNDGGIVINIDNKDNIFYSGNIRLKTSHKEKYQNPKEIT